LKLQFLGANRQVTGSRCYLRTEGARVLIDCGMFQEHRFTDLNWEPSPVPPREIDAVLLTHAHLDHCGLLPKLVEEGFRGPIYTTAASADLTELVLHDSAEIQMEDAAFKRKRHRKEGRKTPHPEIPLYTTAHVTRTVRRLAPVAYGEPVRINSHVTAVFHDAGHILGSAMIELRVEEGGQTRRLIFSGDIGQWDKPIIRDPTTFAEADYVVMESTYGNRDHRPNGDVQTQLARVIDETIAAGGNVVIPAFAIERTQELTYHFHQLSHRGWAAGVPIYLDSPMAIDATEIYRRHRECFDEEAWRLVEAGHSPLGFDGLKMVRGVEESKTINAIDRPAIIMATSGMCNAGRIKHHLRHNLGRPESTILFVGYQAPGTLGRQILDGAREVRIHGILWPVRARIEQIHGLSGHADRQALHRWLAAFQRPPRRLFLNHGEPEACEALAQHARTDLGWEVAVPQFHETVDLG
jgi:metallo-beta-lactamase family protein